mgnify:CR=1 FL=1
MTSAAPSPNPVLAQAWRGGIVESAHRGALAIVDADGAVHTALGDIQRPIFPRSAIKVLQSVDAVGNDMYWTCSGYCGKKQPMVVSVGGPSLRARAHLGGE